MKWLLWMHGNEGLGETHLEIFLLGVLHSRKGGYSTDRKEIVVGNLASKKLKKVCRFCKFVIIFPLSWKWVLFQTYCWYPWSGVIPRSMIFSQEFNYSFQSCVGFIFLQARFVWCYAYVSLYNNLLLAFRRELIFMRIYLFFSKRIQRKYYFSFSWECFMLACYRLSESA